MKFVIAQMQHETNTFSPVPTPWEAFGGKGGPALGRAAYEATKGTRVPMAAYLDLAEAAGAETVTPLAAWANPSGPVDGKAYDRFCELIGNAVTFASDLFASGNGIYLVTSVAFSEDCTALDLSLAEYDPSIESDWNAAADEQTFTVSNPIAA